MSEDRPDDGGSPRTSRPPDGTAGSDDPPELEAAAGSDGDGAAGSDGDGSAETGGGGAAEAGGTAEPGGAPEAAAGPAGATGGPPNARRVVILLAVLGLAIFAAIAVTWNHQRKWTPLGSAISEGGTAAREAPRGPGLPEPLGGVRLSGYVIDGTGAPVAGAEVSAELERGVIDRALSTTPRGAPGSGGAAGSGSAAGAGGAGSAGSAAAGSAGSAAAGGASGAGGAIGAGSADSAAIGPFARAVAAAAGAGSGAGSAAPAVTVAPATGADGRFSLEGLEAGRYRLRVTGTGLVPAEVRYVPVPSDEVRIVISRQVQVDGVVTDGGDPVPNVAVGLRGEAIGGELETRTDAKGEFHFPELPEGRYQVYAWQGALAARAVRLNRLGSGPFPPVELRLEPAAIVVGRVIDRDEGTGLVAAVELRPTGDDQAPRFARTGDDGMFRIEGVPHGRWIADAFAPGYTSPGGVELDAGRGVPELALVRGAAIEGRVLDGQGNPIEGAVVRAQTGEGEAGQELSAEIDRDRLRRYSGRMAAAAPTSIVQPTDDPSFIPRGELGVTVGPIPPIPPPGAQVARAATIDPSVAAQVGEPAPLPIDPARQSIWTTGPDGRYRIRGLPKGKTAVLAVAAGFAEGRSREVVLEASQLVTDVDIVLSPGTILVGRVTNQHKIPVVGAQVTAQPELGAALQAFTDADGTYRLGPVSGKVELAATAFGHDEARRKITLPPAAGREPAEQREDFVLAVADATLAGLLEDAAGATVAGAQIEVIGGAGLGRGAVAQADGTFSIDMLPEGPLRVRVRHPDYPIVELDATATAGGKTTSRLRLPLGGAVEGVLLDDHSGEPLGGLVVEAVGPRGVTAEATAETTGYWKLGPLVPGRWRLAVKTPGYLPLARELDVPSSREPGAVSVRDIRLELRRGALVGGTVRDERGNRLPGAKIIVQAAGGSGPSVEGYTDAQGEFRIRDAPTGEISVTAIRNDARGSIRTTVRPGDEVLGLALEVR
ncbi:MAG TPA: carboxypeptidase-like regulatory domain-containing protein [Kofleriaceae bacterium]|nr:carboxypeptidase-like regulatory domain-containing protein [Kofleriaceae bacterium]